MKTPTSRAFFLCSMPPVLIALSTYSIGCFYYYHLDVIMCLPHGKFLGGSALHFTQHLELSFRYMGTCSHLNLESLKISGKLIGMFCLFSKTQNHLCREPDCHGTGGTGHTHLWSLRRPHSFYHLENFHPKHQQRRKGIMSPKSFRAMEHRLKGGWVCPMPSSLRWARR